ncbi:hypothetical protein P26059A_0071 [Curvibacter phage P26059A]|nr:hypothetical protein P26059A_0071 [Curvibacter phage P26059A]
MQNNHTAKLQQLINAHVDNCIEVHCVLGASAGCNEEHPLWVAMKESQRAMNNEIAALNIEIIRLKQQVQSSDWQPIKTAPKGADSILLGHPDGSLAVAYWGHPFNAMDRDYAWCDESTDYAITWATHWKRKPTAPSKG